MDKTASRPACLVSFWSSVLLVCLQVAYAVTLTSGFLAREAPDMPIGDPYFTVMEVLILAILPVMICFAAGVHALTEPRRRVFSLAGLVFLAVATAITSSVHGAILFLSRDPAFAGMAHVFAFEWPSVVYVLDVLAWDFFFGLFALSLALSFGRHGPERWIRWTLALSGGLSLAGLAGAVTGDMGLRNIGIAGYVGVFTVAVALVAWRVGGRLRQSARSPGSAG